jgi:hypothetical protein
MLEYEDEAESGLGDAVPPGVETGRAPSEFVLGWKSNKGANNGATPYCRAISRPFSSGILVKRLEIGYNHI